MEGKATWVSTTKYTVRNGGISLIQRHEEDLEMANVVEGWTIFLWVTMIHVCQSTIQWRFSHQENMRGLSYRQTQHGPKFMVPLSGCESNEVHLSGTILLQLNVNWLPEKGIPRPDWNHLDIERPVRGHNSLMFRFGWTTYELTRLRLLCLPTRKVTLEDFQTLITQKCFNDKNDLSVSGWHNASPNGCRWTGTGKKNDMDGLALPYWLDCMPQRRNRNICWTPAAVTLFWTGISDWPWLFCLLTTGWMQQTLHALNRFGAWHRKCFFFNDGGKTEHALHEFDTVFGFVLDAGTVSQNNLELGQTSSRNTFWGISVEYILFIWQWMTALEGLFRVLGTLLLIQTITALTLGGFERTTAWKYFNTWKIGFGANSNFILLPWSTCYWLTLQSFCYPDGMCCVWKMPWTFDELGAEFPLVTSTQTNLELWKADYYDIRAMNGWRQESLFILALSFMGKQLNLIMIIKVISSHTWVCFWHRHGLQQLSHIWRRDGDDMMEVQWWQPCLSFWFGFPYWHFASP